MRTWVLGCLAGLACGVGAAAAQEPIFYPVDRMEREFAGGGGAGAAVADDVRVHARPGAVGFDLGRTVGHLAGLRLPDGTSIHPGFAEFYDVEMPDGRTFTLNEAELDVAAAAAEEGEAAFVATSKRLPGVTWRKRYFREGNGAVVKRVTVEGGDAPLFLLKLRAAMAAAPMREGAYVYSSPPGYYGPEVNPFSKGTAWPPGPPLIFPVNVFPDVNATAGVYLSTVNDKPVHGRESVIWFPKDGRLEFVARVGEFLGKGGKDRLTCEWVAQVTPGDAVAFYRAYQARPEFQALMGDLDDPAWFDRVRIAMDCGTRDLLGGDWRLGKPLRDLSGFQYFLNDDPEDAIVWTIFGWGPLAGMPVEGRWKSYDPGGHLDYDVATIRHLVQGLKGGTGRIRVALYDWNHSFDPAAEPYKSHPEWAAWNRDGAIGQSWAVPVFPQWPNPDARPNYLDPGYLEHTLGQIARLPEVYGTDALYIDAEVGQGYADWRSKTWFQPYDQDEFKKKYRLASGENLPLVKNTPNAPYVSGGYWEGRGLVPASEAEARWRSVGAKIQGDKIWQYGTRWTALMGGNRPDKYPNYLHYVVGLGFKPHAVSPLTDYALTRAAYDMRHARLLENPFSPCFWRGDDTDAEAYLVRVGLAAVLPVVNHAAEAKDYVFTLEAAGLVEGAAAPLRAWAILLDGTKTHPEELLARNKRVQDAGGKPLEDPETVAAWRGLRITRLARLSAPEAEDGTLRLRLPAVAPRVLTAAVVTTLPLVALTHGDDLVQMPLPGVADVVFSEHEYADGRHAVTVESRLGATVGAVGAWREVTVDGRPVAPEAVDLPFEGVESAVVLTPGRHRVTFSMP